MENKIKYSQIKCIDESWLDYHIKNHQENIDELHKSRNESKDKFGGVSEEENNDFFFDLNKLTNELQTLQFVKQHITSATSILEKAYNKGRDYQRDFGVINSFEQFLNTEVKI